jgi:hypothetical protein
MTELKPPSFQDEVVVRRSYVDSAGLDKFSVHGVSGPKRPGSVDETRENAVASRREMDSYKDRCWKIGRKAGNEFPDRFESSG